MRLRIFHGDKTLGVLDLEEGAYTVGSGPDASLRIENATLAPEHARILVGDGRAEIEDLGTGRESFFGEEALDGVRPLTHGSLIRLGDVVLQFSEEGGEGRHVGGSRISVGYEIGEVVAAGAMGEIRRVRELHLGREVAMKTIRADLGTEPDTVARFVREAQITARLEHPNVVPVHAVATATDGGVFYTMKFVHGVSLEEIIEKLKRHEDAAIRTYSLVALLTAFQKACDAVAFAHAHGVIHRDLKPANIMLGEYGEVLVMDWGLARIQGDSAPEGGEHDDNAAASATLAGTIMGTPYYMPPEQASGDLDHLDERADVYALGAILYELLTLSTPVRGESTREVLSAVREGRILSPRLRVGSKTLPHIPGGKPPEALEAVTMKALSLAPQRRYQRVKDFQAEIEAWQAGRATKAEAASLWKQLLLLAHRRRREAIVAAAAFVVLASFGALYTAKAIRERRAAQVERDAANAALAEANVERERAEQNVAALRETATTFAAQARALTDAGKVDEALEKIGYAIRVAPQVAAHRESRANLLQGSQRLSEAVAEYEQALALDPALSSARENLDFCRRLLAANGKAPGLLADLQRWLVDELVRQNRAGDAGSLASKLQAEGRKRESEILSRLSEYTRQAGWGSYRLKQLPNGNYQLSLSGLQAGDLAQLSGLPISELSLTNCGLGKIPDLSGLPLTALTICSYSGNSAPRNTISDLSPLRGLALRSLEMHGLPVSDLSPLAALPLETLLTSSARLSDLTPIRSLRLKQASFGDGSDILSDLSPLRGQPLRELNLSCRTYPDLSVLRGLPLEKLRLYGLAGADLEPLRGSELRELYVGNTTIVRDYRPLLDCKRLEKLSLYGSTIHDVWCLHPHPSLRMITASVPDSSAGSSVQVVVMPAPLFWRTYGEALRNRGERLAAFESQERPRIETALSRMGSAAKNARLSLNAENLIELDLGNLPIESLEPLRGLNIQQLNITNTQVGDLSPLSGMPLEILWMGNCPNIRSLVPLAQCKKLESIMMFGLKVTDLSPLRGLPLHRLGIAGASVSDLSPLRGSSLVFLYFANTPVIDLSPLLEIPTLQAIELSRSARNVEVLRQLPALRYLSYSFDHSKQLPDKTAGEFWAERNATQMTAPNAAQQSLLTNIEAHWIGGQQALAVQEFGTLLRSNPSVATRRKALLSFGRAKWRTVWFPSKADPLTSFPFWRRGVDTADGVVVELGALNFLCDSRGPRGLGYNPELTQRGPNANDFGMVATARIVLPAGKWQFGLRSDDGSRLTVNGRRMIDNWRFQSAAEMSATFTQSTTGPIDLVVEYCQRDQGAELQFTIEPLLE